MAPTACASCAVGRGRGESGDQGVDSVAPEGLGVSGRRVPRSSYPHARPSQRRAYLGVFGRLITDCERERLRWLPDPEIEEWVGDGHFVHLVDPDRFATRLRRFIDDCTAQG
jgi:hypothetical protein